tara:strand:+ start:104 stop:391 length:288 start_codon:yes stop_codon:yes gene_type:complete
MVVAALERILTISNCVGQYQQQLFCTQPSSGEGNFSTHPVDEGFCECGTSRRRNKETAHTCQIASRKTQNRNAIPGIFTSDMYQMHLNVLSVCDF